MTDNLRDNLVSGSIILRMRTVSVELIEKALFNLNNFSKIVPFVRLMWKNVIAPERQHVTTYRMLMEYLIPRDTNTNSEYAILIYECASALRYMYISCLGYIVVSSSFFYIHFYLKY
jgi:hypothetical protein